MPKNQKSISADAAVVKNTTFTYAQVDARQWWASSSTSTPTSIPYTSLSNTVNPSYGTANFTPASKTARVTKSSSQHNSAGYVVFSASIDVPAMTEYNVTFNYNINLVRTVSATSSSISTSAELFFFGTTDTSSSLTLFFYNSRTNKSAPYVNGLYWDATGTTSKTLNDTSSKSNITFSNTTNASRTFTAYFGLFGSCGRGTTYNGAIDATVVVSEKVTVTALTPPSVDIASTPYNGNNQYFTFAYDNARTIVTKAEYTPNVGATQVLYDYDIVSDTVISGTNPLNASGVMEAKESGTYTVYFDILNDCGAVWNSTTEDQTTKSVSFTITKKKLTVPTVSAPKQYTGSPQQFNLIDFNGGQDIKMDSVTAATSGHAVTDTSGNTPTDTTGVFLATVVDKYTVMLTPRDTNNYEWDDATGGSGAKSVIFEITEKELLSSAPVSSAVNGIGDAEWEFGDSTVTITIADGRVLGESVNLLFYYDVVGGTSKSNVLTATTTGNTSIIAMPANIPVGKYTLTVELDGATGNNANYKITTNNTLNFEVTSGTVDPSTYAWIYTKDGAAGSTIANNDKLPFALKSGSTVDGVKYELSIQIPAADASVVAEDTSKYVNGYITRSGDRVGTYTTTVALKSIDPTFMFEDASGNKTATTEVTLNWEIEKGTFDLSAVKWEYSLDGATWAEYDPATPPQYNDGYDITVRVKAGTLPAGLSLDALYSGETADAVGGYTANISVSDFVFNGSNFNAPDVSLLTLNWDIAKKNLFVGFKNVKDTYSNANGSGTIIIKELNVPAGFENYITYSYYDLTTGAVVSLADIKNAADPTNEKKYKIEAYIDPAFSANYEVTDGGNVPSDTFVTGSKNKLATATIDGNDGSTPIVAEYDGNTKFDVSQIVITGDDGLNVTDFTVKYYKGNRPVAGNELAAGEVPTNAGEYCVEITLGSVAEKKYILATDWFTVKVEPKAIALPTLGEIVFTGSDINIKDYLGGSYTDYASIIEISNEFEGLRNVSQNGYIAYLKITDPNYVWEIPANTPAPTMSLLKYALTDGAFTVTSDTNIAELKWNIAPIVVDTTNMWVKGNTGATLNLPASVKAFIDAETLTVGYKYYDGASGEYLEEPELKGGRQFKVEAVFGGFDAENGNIVFKTGENTVGTVAPQINYTVPQSGAAAFFGNALSFLKSNWLWFVIALAVLLFLIILIVIIAKRRKNKEERLAKKEAKEEEKRRREEEREAEKRRREQELELEKAKQEAELAKMKAQLGLGAGVAGMAAMAAQPQPVQQPQPYQAPAQAQPQVIQQPYPQVQATPTPWQTPQYTPQQYTPPAQPYPSYGPQPQYLQPQGYDGGMMARIEAELSAIRAEHRTKTEAELANAKMLVEFERLRGDVKPYGGANAQAGATLHGNNTAIPADVVIALIEAVKSGNSAPAAIVAQPVQAALPQVTEESKPVSVAYPPDAVVTTTTTVDTSRPKQAERPRRDETGRNEFFDVDGFYDAFEENK